MKRPVILGGGIALALAALPTIALAQTSEDRLRALEERLIQVESELSAYKDAAIQQRLAELDAEKNKKPGVTTTLGPSHTLPLTGVPLPACIASTSARRLAGRLLERDRTRA